MLIFELLLLLLEFELYALDCICILFKSDTESIVIRFPLLLELLAVLLRNIAYCVMRQQWMMASLMVDGGKVNALRQVHTLHVLVCIHIHTYTYTCT